MSPIVNCQLITTRLKANYWYIVNTNQNITKHLCQKGGVFTRKKAVSEARARNQLALKCVGQGTSRRHVGGSTTQAAGEMRIYCTTGTFSEHSWATTGYRTNHYMFKFLNAIWFICLVSLGSCCHVAYVQLRNQQATLKSQYVC